MAHFAQIDDNNIVLQVIVVANSDCQDSDGNESEAVGIAFCQSLLGSETNWKQTSYNTFKGEHLDGGTQFRKNYAEIGMKYDSTRDAFYEPNKPYASWSFNESTCHWDPPISDPNTENEYYRWDESVYQGDNTKGWVEVE